MDNILKEYEEYLKAKNYKIRGIEEKMRYARIYLSYLENNGLPLNIGIKEAEGFRENMSLMQDENGNSRYSSSTINFCLTHLRNFYDYLISIEKSYSNPFLNIDRLKEKESLPKNILTIEQTKRLLEKIEIKDCLDFKFKVIVELLYSAALRISEAEGLKRDDIDIENGYFMIRDDKDRKDRRLPLSEYCSKLLKIYLKYFNSDPVFYHGGRRRLNGWVNYRLTKLCKKINLPLISCHSLRHTAASQMFKKGADLREVQEYLGHKDIGNTEIYTRILQEDLKKVIEEKHPRESLYAKKHNHTSI